MRIAAATVSGVAMWCALSAAAAAESEETDARESVRRLEQRVKLLEEGAAPLVKRVQAEKPITFGALLEVEAVTGTDHTGVSGSGIAVATVELSIGARINPWAQAELIYLQEKDAREPGEIDQAVLTFADPGGSPLFFSGGRMYVPFGSFETGMVSDPLTLELGETRESALMIGYDSGGVYGSLYAFNGDAQTGGDDDGVNQMGAGLGYATGALDIGIGYISSLADSDGVVEGVADPAAMTALPGGIAASGVFNSGAWTFIGEYVSALVRFDENDLVFATRGARPKAWNLEAGYSGFTLMGRLASAAIGLQRTTEAVGLGLPERKAVAALSVGMMENAVLSLEYASASDYGFRYGGSGERGGTFTVQLAAEF